MTEVMIYTKANCPYCVSAKELLNKKNVQYKEIRIDLEPDKRDEMIARSQRRTVPQIFINNQSVGGCDDLWALERAGTLDQLLGLKVA